MSSRPDHRYRPGLGLLILFGVAGAAWLHGSALPDPQKGHVLVPGEGFVDDLNIKHTRLAHYFHGLRVWGSEAILHEDSGDRSKDRRQPEVTRSPDLDLADPGQAALRPLPIHLDLQVRQDPEAVRRIIRTSLGPEGRRATFLSFEKIIYPVYRLKVAQPAEGQPLNAADVTRILDHHRLAWFVQTRVPAPGGWGEAWDFIVDAHDGAVLERLQAEPGNTPARGRGHTFHSGEVTLDTRRREDGVYELVDPTRGKGGAYGGNAVLLLVDPGKDWTEVLETKDNVWGSGRPGLGLEPDPASQLTNAADAAYGLRCAWDYFRNIHGRDGLDGRGTAVRVVLHRGEADNASYGCDLGIHRISIGPGVEVLPRTDVFTIGHEFAHGVNQTSANLAYSGEPGGLNEANSDIFGKLIETYARQHRLQGQSIGEPARWDYVRFVAETGLEQLSRSMRKPSRDGHSRDTWSRLVASQDPHYGSGPMNRAFSFLAAGASADAADSTGGYSPLLPSGMAGIGADNAARIWYRALTTRLLSQSTYLDARAAMIVAAEELHGRGSAEVQAVRMAMGAVGVGDPDPAPELGSQAARCAATATLAKGILKVTAAGPGIRSVLFLIDGIPARTAAQPPFELVLDTPRNLANGPHAWEARITCADRTSRTLTGPFELDNPLQQLLADPGLEDPGDRSWGPGRAATQASLEAGFAHGGVNYAVFSRVLGKPAGGARVLSQVVKLPAGCKEVTLGFWAWVIASVGDPEKDHVQFLVRTIPAPGASPEVLAEVTLSGRDASKGWGEYAIRLAALENLAEARTVEFRIESSMFHRDARIRLDDVKLLCGTAAEPAAEAQAGQAPVEERKERKEQKESKEEKAAP